MQKHSYDTVDAHTMMQLQCNNPDGVEAVLIYGITISIIYSASETLHLFVVHILNLHHIHDSNDLTYFSFLENKPTSTSLTVSSINPNYWILSFDYLNIKSQGT